MEKLRRNRKNQLKENYFQKVEWAEKIFDPEEDAYSYVSGTCDNKLIIGETYVQLLERMNGKVSPYLIPTELLVRDVRNFIEELKNCGLVRRGRILYMGEGKMGFILHFLNEISNHMKFWAKVLNKVLMMSFLPVFVFGTIQLINNLSDIILRCSKVQYDMGTVVGILLAILIHEYAHMFAAISYDGKVYAVGLGYMLGGFTLMNVKDLKRMQKIQISLAGIESNLFLVGFFGVLSAAFPGACGFFVAIAYINFLLAIENMCIFVPASDGAHIMDYCLGNDEISFDLRSMLENKNKLKSVSRRKYGKLKVAVSCILALGTMLTPFYLASLFLAFWF